MNEYFSKNHHYCNLNLRARRCKYIVINSQVDETKFSIDMHDSEFNAGTSPIKVGC